MYGVVFRLGLGQSVHSIQDKIVTKNSEYTDNILNSFRPDKYISNIIPFFIKAPTWLVPSNKKLDELAQGIEGQMRCFNTNVERGIRDGSAPNSWLRYYIEHEEEIGLSREESLWTLYSLVIAGARSPYNALLGFLVAMMENPEWQRKLQDEVDRVVGPDRLPTFDDLPNLPIVRAVVKESIRWRSLVAEIGIPHMTEVDDFYEGYFIPKGTILHANYR